MPSFIYQAGEQALSAPVTRAKLAQVADRMAGAARGIAAAERVDISIGRESGQRRKDGRPFERVTADADSEWGRAFTPRRRILSRAATLTARTGRARRG